jgi:hypothetical protein
MHVPYCMGVMRAANDGRRVRTGKERQGTETFIGGRSLYHSFPPVFPFWHRKCYAVYEDLSKCANMPLRMDFPARLKAGLVK